MPTSTAAEAPSCLELQAARGRGERAGSRELGHGRADRRAPKPGRRRPRYGGMRRHRAGSLGRDDPDRMELSDRVCHGPGGLAPSIWCRFPHSAARMSALLCTPARMETQHSQSSNCLDAMPETRVATNVGDRDRCSTRGVPAVPAVPAIAAAHRAQRTNQTRATRAGSPRWRRASSGAHVAPRRASSDGSRPRRCRHDRSHVAEMGDQRRCQRVGVSVCSRVR